MILSRRRAGKVVGKPYWGKPDVRFDEGPEESRWTWAPPRCLMDIGRSARSNSPDDGACTTALLYCAFKVGNEHADVAISIRNRE